jgi:hypothetical protein
VNNDRASGIRQSSFLDWDSFCRVIDEVHPYLEGLYFFNYGEPFLHPKSLDMLAYVRSKSATLKIVTTTNGILLDDEAKATRLVNESLVDWINFSIAGVDEETYHKYHQAGSAKRALNAMRRIVDEKRRLGAKSPVVRWRYLLFNWNDSDAQIKQAKVMAKQIGVDEFTFFLCSGPLEARSILRAPGRPGFKAIQDHIDYEFHYEPDPFADAGLYHPEEAKRLGEFCWTSRKATVRAKVSRGKAKVLLSGIDLPAYPAPNVRVTTPFEELRLTVVDDAWNEVRLLVPEGHANTTIPVTLEVDKTFIPFRHGLAPDVRDLGVMLSLATIERPHEDQFNIPTPVKQSKAASKVIRIKEQSKSKSLPNAQGIDDRSYESREGRERPSAGLVPSE